MRTGLIAALTCLWTAGVWAGDGPCCVVPMQPCPPLRLAPAALPPPPVEMPPCKRLLPCFVPAEYPTVVIRELPPCMPRFVPAEYPNVRIAPAVYPGICVGTVEQRPPVWLPPKPCPPLRISGVEDVPCQKCPTGTCRPHR